MHALICANPNCHNPIPAGRRKYCCDYCRKPAWYAKRRKCLKTIESFMDELAVEVVNQREDLAQMRTEIIGFLRHLNVRPVAAVALEDEPEIQVKKTTQTRQNATANLLGALDNLQPAPPKIKTLAGAKTPLSVPVFED